MFLDQGFDMALFIVCLCLLLLLGILITIPFAILWTYAIREKEIKHGLKNFLTFFGIQFIQVAITCIIIALLIYFWSYYGQL